MQIIWVRVFQAREIACARALGWEHAWQVQGAASQYGWSRTGWGSGQGQLHGWAACAEGPTLGLMLCCHGLEILNNVLTRAPHFHVPPGITNYAASPGGRRWSQRQVRGPQHPTPGMLSGFLPSGHRASSSERGFKLRFSDSLDMSCVLWQWTLSLPC